MAGTVGCCFEEVALSCIAKIACGLAAAGCIGHYCPTASFTEAIAGSSG